MTWQYHGRYCATTNGNVIKHGVIILTTGGIEYQPTEYLYHESNHVITQRELEEKLASGENPQSGEHYVMIQCVGSRDEPISIVRAPVARMRLKMLLLLRREIQRPRFSSCTETSVLMG